MFLIHRKNEGEEFQFGVNWFRNSHTKIMIMFPIFWLPKMNYVDNWTRSEVVSCRVCWVKLYFKIELLSLGKIEEIETLEQRQDKKYNEKRR